MIMRYLILQLQNRYYSSHILPNVLYFYEDSFEVGLVSGPTPNIGRVEVKYDDTWSSVCFESKEGDTRSWSFSNAQVTCRELGFPGAMFARRGDKETDMKHSKIYGYKCTEGNHIRQALDHCKSHL